MRHSAVSRYVLTALALLLCVCCGCGSQPDAKTGLDGGAALKIWFSANTAESDALQQIGDRFKKETGIDIEVIDNNVFTVRQKLPVAAKSSMRPDIIFIQSADLGVLADSGYLRPLDCLGEEFERSFFPIARSSFAYKGKQYGAGYSPDAYGLIRNRKIAPQHPANWSEFFRYADKYSSRNNGKLTVAGAMVCPSSIWFNYPVIRNYGGYFFGRRDGQYNPGDIGLANSGSVTATEKLLAMKQAGLTTTAADQADSEISNRFARNEVGMFIYGLWEAGRYQDAGIDFVYEELPANDDGTPSLAWATVQGFVLNQYGKHPNEAEAFLRYMLRDDNQQLLFEAANGNAARTGERNTCNRAVAASEYVQSSPLLSALIRVNNNSEAFPVLPEATALWNYAKPAFDSIFFNNHPVAATLSELTGKLKSDIAKMRQ